MGTVAESLIDQFTVEAIKEKMAEERNSGRASGSGEYGADLWVESMVSSTWEKSSDVEVTHVRGMILPPSVDDVSPFHIWFRRRDAVFLWTQQSRVRISRVAST